VIKGSDNLGMGSNTRYVDGISERGLGYGNSRSDEGRDRNDFVQQAGGKDVSSKPKQNPIYR
jgi:hypothetical protein